MKQRPLVHATSFMDKLGVSISLTSGYHPSPSQWPSEKNKSKGPPTYIVRAILDFITCGVIMGPNTGYIRSNTHWEISHMLT